jgi:hypothetical protein
VFWDVTESLLVNDILESNCKTKSRIWNTVRVVHACTPQNRAVGRCWPLPAASPYAYHLAHFRTHKWSGAVLDTDLISVENVDQVLEFPRHALSQDSSSESSLEESALSGGLRITKWSTHERCGKCRVLTPLSLQPHDVFNTSPHAEHRAHIFIAGTSAPSHILAAGSNTHD